MKSALITWSDRGADGPVPSYYSKRPSSDPGPILRLLGRWKDCPKYEAVWVLTNPAGKERAQGLCQELREHVPLVDCSVLTVSDPSDFAQLFQELGPVLSRLDRQLGPERWQRDVLLSAGTPQMQTLWVILVQAGLLQARMLQVIPDAFVPHPHPSPVREVRLNIDGFPEIRALRDEVRRLRAQVRWTRGEMIGESLGMRALKARIERLAPSELPVLLVGETGTGKELVAKAIHEASARSTGPFVAENCAAFSESLLASELFGHEAGAFTGASGRKRGLFELAHGGTLFLDEVGDMPLAVQASLLRVLQEGQLRRVGGESSVRVEVRLVTATHRDLRQLIQQGRFREDLYYRLQGATLELPALRERAEDLALLIEHFLHAAPPARDLELGKGVMAALSRYSWPGNVRQLRAEVLRWKVFCTKKVQLEDLSEEITQGEGPQGGPKPATEDDEPALLTLSQVVQAAEQKAIEQAMRLHQGNLSRAARALGIDRHTLKRKLDGR